MPFKSEKQRRYLWANEPKIARDWTDKYGSRVKKLNGGIMDAWGKHATATEAMKLMNQPDYHQKAGYNFLQNFPNTPQWLANTLATGYQYGSEGFKALKGGTDFSDAMARAKEEARLNRLGIQGLGFDMGEYENFMQNYNTANELSPLPRLTGLGSIVRPTPQAGQRRDIPRKDIWNIKYGTDETLRKHGDQGWVGGPFKEYNPALDLNKTYRLAMNEYLNRNKSYSEFERIPNEKYQGLEIERNYIPTEKVPLQVGPYKGSRYATTDMKNIDLGQWYKQQQHKKMSQAKKNAAMHQQIQQAEVAVAQQAAAQQVRQNIQTYGNRDRPNIGINRPGGGRGQSPTGGDVAGTPFNQGGLATLWPR